VREREKGSADHFPRRAKCLSVVGHDGVGVGEAVSRWSAIVVGAPESSTTLESGTMVQRRGAARCSDGGASYRLSASPGRIRVVGGFMDIVNFDSELWYAYLRLPSLFIFGTVQRESVNHKLI